MVRHLRGVALSAVSLVAMAGLSWAGGGPHNVLVVANGRSADSVAVANAYRAARGVPQRNVVRLDVPLNAFGEKNILSSEIFRERMVRPLEMFLAAHPSPDRLHFIVLCPDLPLRVDYAKPDRPRSLAAMLTLLGEAPRPAAPNPYLRKLHAFEALQPAEADPIGRQRLVTLLRGYEREDALALVRRSVAADGTAPKESFHFVLSPHVRGFQQTINWLTERGYVATLHDKGKPLAGATDVMGYFSGGSYSGLTWDDVTSNTYRPGALVDMLESYGAEWPNWHGFAYRRQVPVGWFIRAGATGVHGTTDEPYAGAFPSSGHSQVFFANYLAGCNLAETYWSAIPALQWQNAVFGDPLCAPYAKRLKVTVAKVDGGVSASVSHGAAPPPKEVRLFINGRFLGKTDAYLVSDSGTAVYGFDLSSVKLAAGWHELRAVAVDASPAAVQSWAATMFRHGNEAPSLTVEPGASPAAAGDTVLLTAVWKGDATLVLRAGLRDLGTFRDAHLTLDTSVLGPGRHDLHVVARDAEGKTQAQSNILAVSLVEPLHVVRTLPEDTVGRRPVFLLRYNGELPFAEAVVGRAVRLTQAGRSVPVRCTVEGRNLVIEPRRPLKAAVGCTLAVDFPQAEVRSRPFTRTFTPTGDASLLYTLPADARDSMTVEGLIGVSPTLFSPHGKRPVKVVLGPVDLYAPKRPAEWSLPACAVEARFAISSSARPGDKDHQGAGLGVLYSDMDHRAYARVERQNVVLYQVLGGKTTAVASWPAPGRTTGSIFMRVEAVGPKVTVTVDGTHLGSVLLDRHLPPGLPWVDLGAPAGVSASAVKVLRP